MSHLRFSVLAVATIVLVSAFSMTALSQDLLTQKVISMEMAQTMAQATVAQCRANGYRVSVTIIDNSGLLKAFLRDDGSGAGTPDLSRSKAYTALFFRRNVGRNRQGLWGDDASSERARHRPDAGRRSDQSRDRNHRRDRR